LGQFDFFSILISMPSILIALTVHEFSHGYVAYQLGDPTAKSMGRLTLNPLAHLDVIGTIALVLFHFGWAKPVPVNPYYFQNPRRDMMWTSLAGPAANFMMAILLGFFCKLVGIHEIFPRSANYDLNGLFQYFIGFTIYINIILGAFNLLPIPPLDGSNILKGLLPPHLAQEYSRISNYGMFILIGLILFGGAILWRFISLFLRLYQFLFAIDFY